MKNISSVVPTGAAKRKIENFIQKNSFSFEKTTFFQDLGAMLVTP